MDRAAASVVAMAAPDPLNSLDACAPRCPKCGLVVFTRLNACCEQCGGRLPASMVLSDEQRAAYQQQLQQDAARLVRAREATFGPPADAGAVIKGLLAGQVTADIAQTTAALIEVAGELSP